jgi:hypothetical protein
MAGIDENLDDQPQFPQAPIPVIPQAQAAVPPDVDMHVIPPQAAQPRARRTHKDNFISSLLSKLSLREKLSKNKEIEDLNKIREMKKFNHHMDAVAHPDAGSETASFITIDEADLKDLKDPSILARFLNSIPDYLLIRITRETRADKEDREKRKLDELNSHMSDLSQDAKRRRMDGSKAAKRIIGTQRDIEFSDILFTTNAHVPIPLPFFRNENLRYIIDHAATLPTTKSNPLPGETKGQFILNISDMTRGTKSCKGFGEELSLDFGEWSEAAQNCFRFHQMQDKDGDTGPYATWWSSHFNFFNAQEDKISQFNAWKDLELKLRREYRTEPTKFDINHYVMKYEAAKTTYELKLLIEKQNPPLVPTKDVPPRKDFFRPSSRGGKGSGDHHLPFPQGSRQRHPVCCILCGELEHAVSKHYSDGSTAATKFADGKPTWAKISNSRDSLSAPNGKEVCINYNIRGSSAVCSHADGARAHLCSFCGSKSHHAFAWVCRVRPQPARTTEGH